LKFVYHKFGQGHVEKTTENQHPHLYAYNTTTTPSSRSS